MVASLCRDEPLCRLTRSAEFEQHPTVRADKRDLAGAITAEIAHIAIAADPLEAD
jgi:hypothetical protein